MFGALKRIFRPPSCVALHGRLRLGRDFNEVNVSLPRHSYRFHGANDAHLPPLFIDEAYFGNADALVDSWLRRCRLRLYLWSFPQTAPREKSDKPQGYQPARPVYIRLHAGQLPYLAMPPITRAVILAAGLGTRMLPATKSIPKEMLPVVDKPLVQYAVEEAVASGITEIIFVIADGKEAIADHFGHGGRTERMLARDNRADLLAGVRAPADLANFHYRRQPEPLGIAHALGCARDLLEGQPFVLIFPDDLLLADVPVVGQLVGAYQPGDGAIIAVQPVADADVPQYGIVDPEGAGNPVRLRGIIEKPSLADAPSRFGVVGEKRCR